MDARSRQSRRRSLDVGRRALSVVRVDPAAAVTLWRTSLLLWKRSTAVPLLLLLLTIRHLLLLVREEALLLLRVPSNLRLNAVGHRLLGHDSVWLVDGWKLLLLLGLERRWRVACVSSASDVAHPLVMGERETRWDARRWRWRRRWRDVGDGLLLAGELVRGVPDWEARGSEAGQRMSVWDAGGGKEWMRGEAYSAGFMASG